jgi:dTDP-4-dehydrorhamnose 3,5-epimerase
MKFTESPIRGVSIIELEPFSDERGVFARTFCRDEFIRHGLNPDVIQCNISCNKKKGTLRGMHFQKPPCEEAKLVRCFRGEVFDVALDIRRDSDTFGGWFGTVLSEKNCRALYIPEGCAHGFLTLMDDSVVAYQVSMSYHAEAEGGIRWNDPFFSIDWPGKVLVSSQKDNNYPFFSPNPIKNERWKINSGDTDA